MKNLPIGELLKEIGYITEEQIQSALAYQKIHDHMRIGPALIELGYISEKQILIALAQRLNLQTVKIDHYPVDSEAVKLIPRQLAERYGILAVKSNGALLTVITNDPLNFYALEDIRQITEQMLEILLTEQAPLQKAIAYYYTEITAQQAALNANLEPAKEMNREFTGAAIINDENSDAPVIRLIDSLIQKAYSIQASDIHLEPFEDNTMVRMRIDGVIVEYLTLQNSLHPSLIARIKIMSNMDITEKRIPQDGHFRTRVSGEDLNVRVSIIPTVFGEKAVMRLLANNTRIDYSGQFGMNEDAYNRFLPMLDYPHGIIYITGPTGSGKSTTLYMVLERLAKRKVNITTIEDPVEKNIRGVNQTQVNPIAGLTFESGLRSLLRQDPDIIMVGETRDAETAAISVRAAITGHIVLSTLHTNNATASIVRLQDMGIENYLISNSLVGIVAQRLLRKNCPNCHQEMEVTPAERKWLPADVKTVKRGIGCVQCNQTGYLGRIAVHEVVTIDKELRNMIARNATMEEIDQYAIKVQGMQTLQDQALELVRKGQICTEELIKLMFYAA